MSDVSLPLNVYARPKRLIFSTLAYECLSCWLRPKIFKSRDIHERKQFSKHIVQLEKRGVVVTPRVVLQLGRRAGHLHCAQQTVDLSLEDSVVLDELMRRVEAITWRCHLGWQRADMASWSFCLLDQRCLAQPIRQPECSSACEDGQEDRNPHVVLKSAEVKSIGKRERWTEENRRENREKQSTIDPSPYLIIVDRWRWRHQAGIGRSLRRESCAGTILISLIRWNK